MLRKASDVVDIVALVTVKDFDSDLVWGVHNRYVEVTMEGRKEGNEWRVEPVTQFNPPFEVTVLSAGTPQATQCKETAVRDADSYPCFRIQNTGQFNIQGEFNFLVGTETLELENAITIPAGSSIDIGLDNPYQWGNNANNWQRVVGLQERSDNYEWIFLKTLLPVEARP